MREEAPFISARAIKKRLLDQYGLEIPWNKVRWALRSYCGLSYRSARYCAQRADALENKVLRQRFVALLISKLEKEFEIIATD